MQNIRNVESQIEIQKRKREYESAKGAMPAGMLKLLVIKNKDDLQTVIFLVFSYKRSLGKNRIPLNIKCF